MKAIIIGAGLGGMATAIRLAREGWEVKVLEKNVRVGGRLDCHSDRGFLWDSGPSRVTMPFVLRELFEFAGHDIEDYLELVATDPSCRYFFPDGKVFNAWTDPHLFQIEVARREKDQGEALAGFMRHAQGIHDFLAEAHLFHPPRTRLGFFAPRFWRQLRNLSRVISPRSMADVVERHFKHPQVRQVFMHYASCLGASPYRAPAALNFIPFVEMEGGSWYIRGGIYRLAEALEKCARDLKVEILVDAEVSEVILKEQGFGHPPRASGVRLRGGMDLEADAVICNADALHAWARLIPARGQARLVRRYDRRPFSAAPFLILWGVRRRFEQLVHHNVFFSSDPLAEMDDIFKKKRLPSDPTVRLDISARSDPTQAPPGQDNYLVAVDVPALEPDHHWEQMRDSFRDLVLERLEKAGLAGLRGEIVCEKVITPSDFAARNNAYRGAIYGHAFHSVAGALRRPANRCPQVGSFYFVGGATQPGGGIPSVFLSAQRVARAVFDDHD